MKFKISLNFQPTGDQPYAIKELSNGILKGIKDQVLLGVTGSGKTFTIANVIQNIQMPTLILVHNKTLAAQLYMEFKEFFPTNLVEYFVSYYDYYQPEAYISTTNTYIEKELSINHKIEKMRLSTIFSLLSGRQDIIVISSVSCIYGLGNPHEFRKNAIKLKIGQLIIDNDFEKCLTKALYLRTDKVLVRGKFCIKNNIIDIFPVYTDYVIRIIILDNKIKKIITVDAVHYNLLMNYNEISIYPVNFFVTSPNILKKAITSIQNDLLFQYKYFISIGKDLEAQRIKERTEFDLEMMKELGYCSGIENYSRYLDGRIQGVRPFCLLDYFVKNYLMVIDESHVTISQVRAMYFADRSRKQSLVNHGFRLPSAMDNRPLKFDEFEMLQNQTIYVSATPSDYELKKSKYLIIEQIIRPTGLLDPIIEVRSSANQIDNLIEELSHCKVLNERVLITTLTKRMAEELSDFLIKIGILVRYIHSDIDTIKRVEIIKDLREGIFDVLVGVNLLREGLDLPEVSLVIVLDADKEGFLRSYRSLTQIAGRAARNINGKVILYANSITQSMKRTIFETNRRREIQHKYNIENNKMPTPLNKKINSINIDSKNQNNTLVSSKTSNHKFIDINKNVFSQINKLTRLMKNSVKKLDFIQAAKYRDSINRLKNK